MLCPTCPKRFSCKSACNLLETELARIERPRTESLKAPRNFEKLAENYAAEEYFRSIRESELAPKLEEDSKEIERLVKELNQSLEFLTPRQQQCVKLYYWEGLSQERIGELLGISQPAVTQHLNAAYMVLRKSLTESLRSTYETSLYSEGGVFSAHLDSVPI